MGENAQVSMCYLCNIMFKTFQPMSRESVIYTFAKSCQNELLFRTSQHPTEKHLVYKFIHLRTMAILWAVQNIQFINCHSEWRAAGRLEKIPQQSGSWI